MANEKQIIMVNPIRAGKSTLMTLINKGCYLCGSKESLLNIEGFIHHNKQLRCVDIKECRRRQKKIKKVENK